MARKKSRGDGAETPIEGDVSGALTEPSEHADDPAQQSSPDAATPGCEAGMPAAEQDMRQQPSVEATAGEEPPKRWRRNFETLAVGGPGIYSGEDRKFAQVYIAFDKEKPTDEQKAKMTEAGFRYRAAERRWDMPATAASRVKAKSLVVEFTGVTLGASQRL